MTEYSSTSQEYIDRELETANRRWEDAYATLDHAITMYDILTARVRDAVKNGKTAAQVDLRRIETLRARMAAAKSRLVQSTELINNLHYQMSRICDPYVLSIDKRMSEYATNAVRSVALVMAILLFGGAHLVRWMVLPNILLEVA